MTVGSLVRVLEPFAASFPGVYEITEVVTYEGQTVYILSDDAGGFDAAYLELAE